MGILMESNNQEKNNLKSGISTVDERMKFAKKTSYDINDNPNQYIKEKKLNLNGNLMSKNETFLTKIERIGYKSANGMHKFFVLGMFTFIMGNFVYFLKEYNAYWRARRNPNLIFDMEKTKHNQNPK